MPIGVAYSPPLPLLSTLLQDQLAAAATGGGDEGGGVDAYGDGGGESGHYGDEEDDDAFTTFRKKHAGRGKELISRIISKEPPAYSGLRGRKKPPPVLFFFTPIATELPLLLQTADAAVL